MSYKAICLALLLASAAVALASQDPELQQCKHQCHAQRHADDKQVRQCEDRCEDYHRQKHHDNDRSPIQKLRECNRDCERRHQEQEQERGDRKREDCQRRCQERYEKETQSYEERGRHGRDSYQEREEYQSNNPYVFEDRHFFTGMQTQHGRLRILQQFTERSDLLRGIENYRIAVLEAQPQTFVVPSHLDAEILVFVARGHYYKYFSFMI